MPLLQDRVSILSDHSLPQMNVDNISNDGSDHSLPQMNQEEKSELETQNPEQQFIEQTKTLANFDLRKWLLSATGEKIKPSQRLGSKGGAFRSGSLMVVGLTYKQAQKNLRLAKGRVRQRRLVPQEEHTRRYALGMGPV